MSLPTTNTTIQILRSYANTDPQFLYDGQLAYSFVNQTLYIGNTAGNTFAIAGNSSFNSTKLAWQTANSAYSIAQGAYDTANLAATQTQAGVIFNTANIAFRQANTAFAAANVAQGIATAAFNAANTGAQAQLAYGQANAAFAKANTIDAVAGVNLTQNNSITSAWTTANAAYNVANNALANGDFVPSNLPVSNLYPSIPATTKSNFLNT